MTTQNLIDLSGVVRLRRDLIRDGYTDRQIATSRRAGVLHRVRHGAYVDGDLWRSLSPADQHRVLARAVLRQSHKTTTLTHISAAIEHRAPVWDVPLDVVHTTRTDGKAGRREPDRRQHRSQLPPEQVVVVNGVPVTRADRTAVEVTTVATTEPALVMVNGLLQAKATDEESVAAMATEARTWPGSLTTNIVIRLMSPLMESAAESRFHYLCFHHSLPRPRPQVAILDEHGWPFATVDFAWVDLGVFLEIDGREKYFKYRRPGESLEDYLLREKQREEKICLLTGWICIRVTWADLADPHKLAARIRRILESRKSTKVEAR